MQDYRFLEYRMCHAHAQTDLAKELDCILNALESQLNFQASVVVG
jgi:hypothetical protein